MENELEYSKYLMHVVLTELMAGRTFFPDYYKGRDWIELSRADRVICILQSYLGNFELGLPEGFEEVVEDISRRFLNRRN